MKKFFRTFLLIALVAIVAISLASCGNKASNPDDVSGSIGDIKWSYTKSDRTLTISGSGEVTGFGSSQDVPWKEVRSAVETIRFKADEGGNFTKIGSYAFYGMHKLESVSIPEGVESIGECSFAFCSAMTDVTLPDTLTSVGKSAFEACSSLESVEIPEAVASIGEGAFAFCRSLESATIYGNIQKIEKWTFRDCVALQTLRMDAAEIDTEAFVGAAIDKDGVKSLRTSVVSVTCKDEEGNVIGGNEEVAVLEVGEKKDIEIPTIDGYELASDGAVNVEGTGEPITVEYIYRKIISEEDTADVTEEATEAPAADNDDKKSGVGAVEIIAIIIFVVVIAAIVVGAVLLMRSDKKTTKDSMTVHKNANGKNNNKKGKKK